MIGSAQFGLDYGIQNSAGQILPPEIDRILTLAYQKGITYIDTAYAYGSSETHIGNFIRKTGFQFSIVSKLPPVKAKLVEKVVRESLTRTSNAVLYGYLIHDITEYKSHPSIFSTLERMKRTGHIKKIGFSLYYPQDLKYLFKEHVQFDLIQIPYNCFDQRFAKYFPILKRKGVEVHARSVFLQGLVFMDPSRIPAFFKPLSRKLHRLHSLAESTQIPISSLCLLFTLANRYIDKIIIGVDSAQILKEDLRAFRHLSQIHKIYPRMKSLKENNENLIVPTHWPKNS